MICVYHDAGSHFEIIAIRTDRIGAGRRRFAASLRIAATPWRKPSTLTERAVIPGIPNSRVWLDDDLAPFIQAVIQDDKREREALARAGKTTDPLPPANLLAISGGSDAGAFAAGLLAGWTAHGTRPEFRLVTGISTGALIAPFAFLGPRYDDLIRSVFTSVRSEDIFHRRNVLIGLASDGMADSEPLSRLAQVKTSATISSRA